MREVIRIDDRIIERIGRGDIQLSLAEWMLQRGLDGEALGATLLGARQRKQQLDLPDLGKQIVQTGLVNLLIPQPNGGICRWICAP